MKAMTPFMLFLDDLSNDIVRVLLCDNSPSEADSDAVRRRARKSYVNNESYSDVLGREIEIARGNISPSPEMEINEPLQEEIDFVAAINAEISEAMSCAAKN
jgi:hypothetical protein